MWISRLADTLSNYMFSFSVPVDKPVDFLGLMYSSPGGDSEGSRAVNEAFMDEFRSLIWLTYRCGFSESLTDKNGASVGIYSDAGWGCAIRVSQMLIAQCLRSTGVFSRDSILRLFFDTREAPLSIHKMVEIGDSRFGKRPSDWFGPTTGARAISSLFNESNCCSDLMRCVVFDSGQIYKDEVVFGKEGVILILSHRLGLESLNLLRYKATIKSLFGLQFFQGIASGESYVSAYYFFAACDDYLYYLDPHTVQSALTDVHSHTHQPRVLKMRWNRLNPSLSVGFVVKNSSEFDTLCDSLRKLNDLFEINDSRPVHTERSFIHNDDDFVTIS